ncbi:hypothetical protein QYF61_012971 [Mycteria americana]|uniref:Reverse transcriptase domain-containing protein n=1 Tax=Mycteria americana TaxID=33587 RepID=A0AAN7NTH9_MYCAM|nr:hypothetical protein QYF61_012971 [Mycteria americana]
MEVEAMLERRQLAAQTSLTPRITAQQQLQSKSHPGLAAARVYGQHATCVPVPQLYSDDFSTAVENTRGSYGYHSPVQVQFVFRGGGRLPSVTWSWRVVELLDTAAEVSCSIEGWPCLDLQTPTRAREILPQQILLPDIPQDMVGRENYERDSSDPSQKDKYDTLILTLCPAPVHKSLKELTTGLHCEVSFLAHNRLDLDPRSGYQCQYFNPTQSHTQKLYGPNRRLHGKEAPRYYRPVSLTSLPGKILEQILLEAIFRHLKNKPLIWNSQQGFKNAKSYQTNLLHVAKAFQPLACLFYIVSIECSEVSGAQWDSSQSTEGASRCYSRTSSIIYQRSWESREVPTDWKLANVIPIYKKGVREDTGKSKPFLENYGEDHSGCYQKAFKDNAIIRHSQQVHKGKVLTNLISFYKVTHLVDVGKAVDVVFWILARLLITVPHSILLDKLSSCGMSRYMVHWVENWLHGRAQRVVVNGATSGWQPASGHQTSELLPKGREGKPAAKGSPRTGWGLTRRHSPTEAEDSSQSWVLVTGSTNSPRHHKRMNQV